MIDPEALVMQRPLRICYLEDHADTHQVMLAYFTLRGHIVDSCYTVAAARLKLQTTRYDVFISDINLPDGNGWELMRTVRLFHPLYAVAVTALGEDADRTQSKAAGFRGHLLKPCRLSEIDKVLAEATQTTSL